MTALWSARQHGQRDASDLASGPLAAGSSHTETVKCVAFSPDGTWIVSGSKTALSGCGLERSGQRPVARSPVGAPYKQGELDRLVSPTEGKHRERLGGLDGQAMALTFVNTWISLRSISLAATPRRRRPLAAGLGHRFGPRASLEVEGRNSYFDSNSASIEGGALSLIGDSTHVDAYSQAD